MTKPASASPLLTAPIPATIRRIAIPFGIGAFFNTMFNVVDTIYGGLISDDALAALSFSFPIAFIIIALGFGFSLGGTALIGNAVGEGDTRLAQKYAVQSVLLAIIASLLTTVLVVAYAPAMLTVMGATDAAYRQLALDYINPLYYGAIFFLIVQALFAILNALGNTIPGRNFLIAGFFLNLLLNPWFIFGGFGLPAMSIRGIAWATVVVQVIGCLYALFEVSRAGLVTRESLRSDIWPKLPIFRDLIQQGLPATADILGVSAGFFLLNTYASGFGQNAVAALGAGSRIEQVALLPVLGINTAILALTAQNNGAGNIDRIYETLRVGLRYGLILMLTTMTIIIVFAEPLMGMFTDNGEILEIGVEYIRIRAFALLASTIYFTGGNIMRGLKRPYWPLFLNLLRFLALPWIFILIFLTWLGYGLTALWVTSTVAFYIVGFMSLYLAYRILPPEPKSAV